MTRIYPKRLLIKCPNWLGDVMMSLSTIKAIKRDNPDCAIIFYWHRKFEALQEFLPWVDEFCYHDDTRSLSAWMDWISTVKKMKVDSALICVNSFKSAFLTYLSGVGQRLGFSNGRSLLMTHGVRRNSDFEKQHRSKWYQAMARPFLDADVSDTSALEFNEAMIKLSDEIKLLLPPSFVVLSTGAAYGPAKEYGLASYQELILKLQDMGHRCVLIGAASELERSQQLASCSDQVINLVSKTSMSEMLYVLSLAEAVIGNDSGPMHVSALLGKKTCGIFGSTHPSWTGPIGPKASFIYKEINCSPCYSRNCLKQGDEHMKCMKDISVEEIIKSFEIT